MSACLLGESVRWDGGHRRSAFLADTLAPHVEWVPVCPEVELGLGVPREPIRLEGDPVRPRLIAPGSGQDHTQAMRRLAHARVEQIARLGLSGYVLKASSPSCGMEHVAVHGPGGRVTHRGTGLFARALLARLPLLPVEDEVRLEESARRENFIERVFAHARWTEARRRGMTRARLGAFHAAHELVLLAHDPPAHRRLDALVRSARPLSKIVAGYGAGFMQALRRNATARRHAVVLHRVLAGVAGQLSADNRGEIVSLITDYLHGRAPLVVPLTLLRHHVRRLGDPGLTRQVYLDVHPGELILRNHV